jgi:peptidoglycan lytic transglycosylase
MRGFFSNPQRWVTIIPFVFFLSSCATYNLKSPERSKNSPPPPSVSSIPNYREVGLASWYGPGFYGRKTASGERFKKNKLTCAHRTLPFGTQLMVTNLENGKNVEVTVNDRGPFVRNKIIDLSPAAAKELGLMKKGFARVELRGARAEEEILAFNPKKEVTPPPQVSEVAASETKPSEESKSIEGIIQTLEKK